MKSYTSFFLLFNRAVLFFIFLLLSSCESSTNKARSAIQSPENMEVKTYEVKDSTGKSQGWGYDIYVGNTKTIHQPIIPAIPGNKSFKTEDDAFKTGLFAVNKMKTNAALPTLLIKELDSLGIINPAKKRD